MIHPSYYELMDKMNEVNKAEGVPEITSRYFIVLAASKRARQLTDGAEPKVNLNSPKLLSVAVDEFYEGAVRIVKDDAPETSADADPSAEDESVQEAQEAPAES